MIDLDALSRHGRAQIAHFPVWLRLGGVPGVSEFMASFLVSTGGMLTPDGGLIFEQGGSAMASKTGLPNGLTEQAAIELKQADGSWKLFKVGGVTGVEDANATEVRFTLEPENK